jgi:hypothetical protein|tara:strand:- start:296 stop:430 length:135 start_codon:yes stop_codon:yes gene_type:complete
MADSKAYAISKDDLFLMSVFFNMILAVYIANIIEQRKENNNKNK